MAGIRYRSGLDGATGKRIFGAEHLAQSLSRIWTTNPGERVMLLNYGSDLRSRLGEDITPALALVIYNDLVSAAARWEPEAVINTLQLVRLASSGLMGLKYSALYYPEGRFGIYDYAIPLNRTLRAQGGVA